MFEREAHDGIKKISQRKEGYHNYNGALHYDKYRQHLFKIHAGRCTRYERRNMEKVVQYFNNGAPYSETIDGQFGLTDVRGYLVNFVVMDKITNHFLCEGTERSVEILHGSLTPAGNEY